MRFARNGDVFSLEVSYDRKTYKPVGAVSVKLTDPVYAGLPDIPQQAQPKLTLLGKAIKAQPEEVADNPRARSAVLRIAVRL